MAIDTSLLDTKYNNLYQAQLNPLKQQTASKINTFKQQQQDTTNKYKNIYAGLDQQGTEAKDNAYTQGNAVDTGVNQNLNRVQEIMAKNGWLGGGENLQAQLNSNSDRMNGQGKVTQDLNKNLLNISNSRNTNQTQEQSDYNNLANQITNATNEGTASETALAQNIAGQKADELSKLQQAEADRQFQAQQAALSRQATVAKASSTSTKTNGLSYKDYFTQGNNMLGSTYLDGEGNHVNKYSNNDVLNWLGGLNMAPEDKARLANDLGLQKQASSPASNTQPTANLYDYVKRYGLR